MTSADNRKSSQSIVPDDFNLRFQRGFGLLAFSANRHIVDHMRRIGVELSMDLEMAQIWGTLAHMNVLPNLPLGANPMAILNEMGREMLSLEPIRLSQLSQITGLPRETVRRKLERLSVMGKVERCPDGRWLYRNIGVTDADVEFTRKTVLQLLATAQTLLTILAQVQVDPPKPEEAKASSTSS